MQYRYSVPSLPSLASPPLISKSNPEMLISLISLPETPTTTLDLITPIFIVCFIEAYFKLILSTMILLFLWWIFRKIFSWSKRSLSRVIWVCSTSIILPWVNLWTTSFCIWNSFCALTFCPNKIRTAFSLPSFISCFFLSAHACECTSIVWIYYYIYSTASNSPWVISLVISQVSSISFLNVLSFFRLLFYNIICKQDIYRI